MSTQRPTREKIVIIGHNLLNYIKTQSKRGGSAVYHQKVWLEAAKLCQEQAARWAEQATHEPPERL